MVHSGLVVPSSRQSRRSAASISMTGFIQRSSPPSLSDGVLKWTPPVLWHFQVRQVELELVIYCKTIESTSYAWYSQTIFRPVSFDQKVERGPSFKTHHFDTQMYWTKYCSSYTAKSSVKNLSRPPVFRPAKSSSSYLWPFDRQPPLSQVSILAEGSLSRL